MKNHFITAADGLNSGYGMEVELHKNKSESDVPV
jgi:hypothetical protein